MVAVSVAVAAVSLALLGFALVSRQSAISAQATAKSRALAAQSESELSVDPELSILLARQALETKATPDALFALRGALDGAPLLRRLPAPQARSPFSDGPTIAYDPVAPRLAEGHCNGELLIFASADGRVLRRFKVAASAPGIGFSPDGKELAIGTLSRARGGRGLGCSAGAAAGWQPRDRDRLQPRRFTRRSSGGERRRR